MTRTRKEVSMTNDDDDGHELQHGQIRKCEACVLSLSRIPARRLGT